jgi:hypothetical protein
MKEEKWPPEGAIEELLKLAGVLDNLITRRALQDRLDQARLLYSAFVAEQKPIPRKSYTKVATTARRLQAAIVALSRDWEPRDRCWLGEKDRTAALELLPRIVAAADWEAKPRKRSRPRRDDLLFVVDRAALFFEKYSAPVTSYQDGPFAEFAQQFFAVVTDGATHDLADQLRTTAKRMKVRRAVAKLSTKELHDLAP